VGHKREIIEIGLELITWELQGVFLWESITFKGCHTANDWENIIISGEITHLILISTQTKSYINKRSLVKFPHLRCSGYFRKITKLK